MRKAPEARVAHAGDPGATSCPPPAPWEPPACGGRLFCRIRVAFDPGRLSPNRRMHPALRRSVARVSSQLARAAWVVAGSPRAPGKVRVTWIVRRARRCDDDNLIAALKQVRDGLFTAAITPDDSPRWIGAVALVQECASCWSGRDAHVEVVVEQDP